MGKSTQLAKSLRQAQVRLSWQGALTNFSYEHLNKELGGGGGGGTLLLVIQFVVS